MTTPETLPAPPEAPSPPSGYQHLTHSDTAKVLRLHDEGLTQVQIAAIIGVNHRTIGRCLKRFEDTADLAVRRLKASAQQSAERVIDIAENGKPDVALKAAKVVLAASGVTERVTGVALGIQVVIGAPGQPAVDARSVTVTAVDITQESGGNRP